MHSVILTIHNGERCHKDGKFLLERVLDGIIQNTTGDYELLCMLDGCTDNSSEIVQKYVEDYKHVDIKPIVTPDIFELRTNNEAFKASKGEYVVVVQDDQIVKEHGWNLRMQKPFDAFDDVFAVTARTAHNWIVNPNSVDLGNSLVDDTRFCDIFEAVDHASGYPEKNVTTSRETFAVRGTANRGPLMMNLSDLKAVNYLDDKFAPCDMDDHDLMFRVYKQLGKVCGLYRVGIESDHSWSAAIQKGKPKWAYRSHFKNCRIFYERNNDILNDRRIVENRILK